MHIRQMAYLCMPGGYFGGRTSENSPSTHSGEYHPGLRPLRRAVVPEVGEPAVRVMRARVVRVQRATVAQLQIGFRNHPPSLRAVPLLFAPELRRTPLLRTQVNKD